MKTYARYRYTYGVTAQKLGNEWHEVTAEFLQWYPSGRRLTVVVNGMKVKADDCELIQVFDC